MQKPKIRHGDWVIVGDGKFLNLKTREVHEHPDPKTRELGTDAPGRAFNSVGAGRSAMEQTDWHAQEEDSFLRKLADRLDAAVNAGEAKSLILVAPPRAPKSTRIWSSFPCTRLSGISQRDALARASTGRGGKSPVQSPTPPWLAASRAYRHCRTGLPRRPCRARAALSRNRAPRRAREFPAGSR